MFKVGDKVKVVKGHCYPDSRKVYEVAYYGPGDYEATKAYTYVGLVEEEGRWSPDRFELVKPEPQAAAIAGGLQEHSVGEYYPLAAVMYEHNGKRIITIENLQTGEVNAINGEAINWETFEDAYKRMESKPFTNWTKGRVSYVHGRWVVAEPVNPVRVTRLRNMLHRG